MRSPLPHTRACINPWRQAQQMDDAIRKHDEEEVARLVLEQGADPRRARVTACLIGSLRVLRRLLAPPISVDPNERRDGRDPPLAICVTGKRREAFELLLAAGARGGGSEGGRS